MGMRLVEGFGRAGASAATIVDVEAAELAHAITALPDRGGIARGLGRSYGDAAQNAGGHVLRVGSSGAEIAIDTTAGTATVGAGVAFDDLVAHLVPAGWFVPVTPGTRRVTVGGAIASDIHGKNHHVDGSIGRHVVGLRMMLADTTIVDLGPERDAELFWATVGGMGLTGIIVEATIRLIRIETSRMAVDIRRAAHLDDVMAHMVATDDSAHYSVAWIDLLARGARLGRGVITNAEHATVDQLGSSERSDPLAYSTPSPSGMPRALPPGGVINRASVGAFNELWYRRAPVSSDGVLQTIPTYFHPLDQLRDWNRVYGRRGFVQYQFVVPDDAAATVRTVAERLSDARVPVFLAVLKRFGSGTPAPLSFPMAGWTLAVDLGVGLGVGPGAGRRALAPMLRSLDEIVLDAGGRHYLAKDFHIGPAALRRGYPDLDRWLSTRRRVDPAGVWMSDQARRLGLVDRRGSWRGEY